METGKGNEVEVRHCAPSHNTRPAWAVLNDEHDYLKLKRVMNRAESSILSFYQPRINATERHEGRL